MEEKLQAIIAAIDDAQLLDSDKDALLASISQGLRQSVLPVLLKHMSKESLTVLSAHPVTVDAYAHLIEGAVQDGHAIAEIVDAMESLLASVQKALTESGIQVPEIVHTGASV